MSKWYGKIIFDGDSQPMVETYCECATEIEARNFVNGFKHAQELCENSDDCSLEEYTTCVDQIEPEEE